MGAASETDGVKDLNRRIDEILEILKIQNSLLCQILPQSAKMSSGLKELAGLQSKLDAMNLSLSTIKDFVRFK